FLTKVKALTAVVLAVFLAAGVVLVGHALAAPAPTQDQPAVSTDQKDGKPEKDETKKQEPKKDGAPTVKRLVVAGSGNVTFQQGGRIPLSGAALKAEAGRDGVLLRRGKDDGALELRDLPDLLRAGGGDFIGKDTRARRGVLPLAGWGKIVRLSGTADEQ